MWKEARIQACSEAPADYETQAPQHRHCIPDRQLNVWPFVYVASGSTPRPSGM